MAAAIPVSRYIPLRVIGDSYHPSWPAWHGAQDHTRTIGHPETQKCIVPNASASKTQQPRWHRCGLYGVCAAKDPTSCEATVPGTDYHAPTTVARCTNGALGPWQARPG